MLACVQVLTVMVAAVAMGLSLAHALELPGKMRLGRETYEAMQRVYYPGFTVGGLAEPLGIALTIALLPLTPRGSAAFWLTLLALLGLAGMQAVYWLVTHPVNKTWVAGEAMAGAGAKFFAAGGARDASDPARARPWTELRDRWEYSHVARAALAAVSLLALAAATAIS